MGPPIKVAKRVGWGKCDCQKMLPNNMNRPIYIVTKIMPNILVNSVGPLVVDKSCQ